VGTEGVGTALGNDAVTQPPASFFTLLDLFTPKYYHGSFLAVHWPPHYQALQFSLPGRTNGGSELVKQTCCLQDALLDGPRPHPELSQRTKCAAPASAAH
jgi:hypothetical protein